MADLYDCHWVFGDHCHILFPGGGTPVVGPDQAFTTGEGCAAVSDSLGKLLSAPTE